MIFCDYQNKVHIEFVIQKINVNLVTLDFSLNLEQMYSSGWPIKLCDFKLDIIYIAVAQILSKICIESFRLNTMYML